VAALVGRQASRALLVALATQTEEMTLAALAVACRSHLLEEADDTYRFVHDDTYRFVHDVIREVIESDIGAGRRALLHRRVAEVLGSMPGEPAIELLAYHYDRAGMEEQASRYLEQAGDRARGQAAHMAAAQYYREAAARLEALGRREDAARVRVRLGTLLTTAARYEDALRVLEEAAALYDAAHDSDGLGRAVAQIGYAHADQGTLEVGIRRLQTLVIPLTRDGAARGLAALNAALASLFFVAGHYDEQLAAAAQAAELARTIGDSRVLLQARLSLGTALIMTGRSDEALPVLEETISVAESLGDLDSLSRALTSAASIYINRSAFETSMGYIDRALRVAERVGDPVRTLRALCYRGSIDLFTGQWPRARGHFERALAASHEVGMSAQYAYPVFYLGFLTLCEGGWGEAASLLDDSIRIAEPIGDLQVLRWAYATRAECDLLQGHPDQARDRLAAFCRPVSSKSSIAQSWQGASRRPRRRRVPARLSAIESRGAHVVGDEMRRPYA